MDFSDRVDGGHWLVYECAVPGRLGSSEEGASAMSRRESPGHVAALTWSVDLGLGGDSDEGPRMRWQVPALTGAMTTVFAVIGAYFTAWRAVAAVCRG
jgi:hypothetical protein